MYGVNPAGIWYRNLTRCDIMSPHERQYDIILACFAHLGSLQPHGAKSRFPYCVIVF